MNCAAGLLYWDADVDLQIDAQCCDSVIGNRVFTEGVLHVLWKCCREEKLRVDQRIGLPDSYAENRMLLTFDTHCSSDSITKRSRPSIS